jgi:hypothetical protein
MTPQVKQRVCAVLGCRKRGDLIPIKAFTFAHLIEIDLCREHEVEHNAVLHEKFRDSFGIDFVDPERQ